jgi:hypothetical protein
MQDQYTADLILYLYASLMFTLLVIFIRRLICFAKRARLGEILAGELLEHSRAIETELRLGKTGVTIQTKAGVETKHEPRRNHQAVSG